MAIEMHKQWSGLDFPRLLSSNVAFVNTDSQNSILNPDGCLSHEQIWRNANKQGGPLFNTLRLASAARKAAMQFLWLRYDRFIGEIEPTNEIDRVQYHFWNKDYDGDRAKKDWEADLVQEIKEVMQPGDITLVYPAWSIFTGTPVDRWLNQWGTRTLLISGYHTDWCVEMATRHARDLGYIPIVVGDACGSTQPLHDQTLDQINTCYAPVITTDAAIGFIEQGLEGRQKFAAN
ncbi:Nicotinamidase-related amidase [Roseovarius lutimaris]|uniref:Nicotinamidase-related amidase n=1 Tax=Roseovarius lutimaris TaxID=1005928 RepID=A0A1I5GT77_9RHOB|nr:cysteine hydrolase [Roseovarius lutimaris]SFO38781.1 Nicotinamidase-related amidase [Roseovarius lutimaris]